MRAGELCAGYGGLALAVEEVFGAETAWFSEFDPAPSKILKHHWPDVPNHGDMTQIDWAAIEQVDIISGGTPCQDLSAAGRRKGMTEGTRSNLWVNMREAIAIQQPLWVAWENVRGAFSAEASSDLEFCPRCMGDPADGGTVLRALGRVLGDLSDLGYDCQWRGLRAADVGACHGRFRVFVLAANRDHLGKHWCGQRAEQDRRGQPAYRRSAVPNTEGLRWGEGRTEPARIKRGLSVASDSAPAANAGSATIRELTGGSSEEEARTGSRNRFGNHHGEQPDVNWGPYGPAIRRWETRLGRPAPRPTEPTGRDGGERLSPRFTEWMMGLTDGWVTDPTIGISRNEQLKACGNGVVPQQAAAALRDMLAAFEPRELAA